MILLELLLTIFATGWLINNLAKAHIVRELKNIETYTKMYGSKENVETTYIAIMITFSRLDIVRRYVMLKDEIMWRDWFKFVERKLSLKPSNIHKLDYDSITYEQLASLLREFRKEVF